MAPDPIKLGGGLRLNGYVDTPTILTDPLGLSSKITVADGKWDWVFGRVNANRSRQIASELAKIGIKDDPEGRSIVIKALNQAVKDGNVLKARPTPVGTTTKMLQGQITGPEGTIDMEAGFEVKPNGDYSFTTLIPKS